jgi:uncharacterized membrane protein YqjE
MATEVQNPQPTGPTTGSLVAGIVNDIQDLVKQQVQLTRKELEQESNHGKDAVMFLVLGRFMSLAGVVGLCLTLALLIHWLAAPAGTYPPGFPLWASFAIAGATFVGVGIGMLFAAKKSVEAIGTPLHESARALKETFEWKTNPR